MTDVEGLGGSLEGRFLLHIPFEAAWLCLGMIRYPPFKTTQQQSRTTAQKNKSEGSLLPCNRLSRNTRVKVTPVARPLLKVPAQKLCRFEHCVLTSSKCVRIPTPKSFSAVRDAFSNVYAEKEGAGLAQAV
jgi:hypothetical protein